jgi:tetratricopeptide (TPR) repeat protein
MKTSAGPLQTTMLVTAAVLLVVSSSCQPPKQGRKLAKERWDKVSAQIKFTLAQQLYDNGDYEQAEKTVRQCLHADSKIAPAHLLLGKLLLANSSVDSAMSEFQRTVAIDPNLDEGWYLLGVSAQQQRDQNSACEYYKKAMSLNPANADYVLAVADIQVANDDFAQAEALLCQKMAAIPRDVPLKVAAADLMCRNGKNDRAIELYEQALLMTEDNEHIAEALGYCCMFSGRWKQAADIFYELVRKCQNEQQKRLYLAAAALCSMECGQYDTAVRCYRELQTEQRDNAAVWTKMGQAALGAGAVDRALRCGREALALRPDYADALILLGCAQYAGGEYVQAVKAFEKITPDNDNGGFLWIMRARCYEHLGQMEKAEDAREKASKMDPQGELADFLAKTMRLQG